MYIVVDPKLVNWLSNLSYLTNPLVEGILQKKKMPGISKMT
jgi:hypothetical protein